VTHRDDCDIGIYQQHACSNAVLQSTSYGFQAAYIERLSRADRFKDAQRPRLIAMSADACGGGNDEFAIFAGYRVQDKFVVRIDFIFFLNFLLLSQKKRLLWS
jgi:hypothetical protein